MSCIIYLMCVCKASYELPGSLAHSLFCLPFSLFFALIHRSQGFFVNAMCRRALSIHSSGAFGHSGRLAIAFPPVEGVSVCCAEAERFTVPPSNATGCFNCLFDLA